MATDVAIADLTALGAAPAGGDLLVLVDISDPTESAEGTTKNMTITNLFASPSIAAPTLTGQTTLTGGTVTTSTPVLTATQTWNAGGVTFTGIKLDVTNTASAAGSILLDLEVGGVSQFNVTKIGNISALGILSLANTKAIQWGNTTRIVGTSAYTLISSPSGDATITTGDTGSGDASTYYDNTTHTFRSANTGTTFTQLTSTGLRVVTGGVTHASTTLILTTVALANGAGAFTGTLTNAPAATNPTKWVPINDNGTVRYLPAW